MCPAVILDRLINTLYGPPPLQPHPSNPTARCLPQGMRGDGLLQRPLGSLPLLVFNIVLIHKLMDLLSFHTLSPTTPPALFFSFFFVPSRSFLSLMLYQF